MKISTRGRYGTRALLELALNDSGESVLLRDIAANSKFRCLTWSTLSLR